MFREKFHTEVTSEIGELEAVILHPPGQEIENMNPENAEKALYSDILNLAVASKEYEQLDGVLKKVSKVFYINDLLKDVVSNEKVKERLINKICKNEKKFFLKDQLYEMAPNNLAEALIQGIPSEKDTLTKFLSKDIFALQPLHNFFFTRDASIAVRDKIIIADMKSVVRERESILMESIFDFSSYFTSATINPENDPESDPNIVIEGGDIIVAREDVFLMGIGGRSNSQGVDFLIDYIKKQKSTCDIIVQEMPESPESFIHLDMAFTFLDKDKCMVYEPLILKQNRYQTVHIRIDNGQVKWIRQEENILKILKKLGMDLKPIMCGGTKDLRIQEREQWHSGANFFAFGPGKVLGYNRNVNTIEELDRNGFEVIKAKDVIADKVDLKKVKKCVVTIEGSELSRGGGGCRCMTMPIKRKKIKL